MQPARSADTAADDIGRDHSLITAPRDADGRPLLGGIPLMRRIGRGGMGTVYYGIHPRLQVEVAVKVLPHHLVEEDPRMVERFREEGRMAAHLSSEHLVRVIDVNQEADIHYLVMEYVPGESAGAYLRRLRELGRAGLAEREALEIVTAAAKGLAAAHVRGIIHRDIKPDNILIPRGSTTMAKLADPR